MPISVLGMHRSGTSLLTNLLADLGVNLGPENDLLPPTAENPLGYYERESVMHVNEHVLAVLDGSWDDPPSFPAAWIARADLDEARDAARLITSTFPQDEEWAWKDPRLSLLLPFWEDVLGTPTSVVVTLRNPLDVARSLHRRGQVSERLALRLWDVYTRSAMQLARERTSVVSHYDSYFVDPVRELRRLCEGLGIEASDEAVVAATRAVAGEHRHSSHTLHDLLQSRAPDDVVATYIDACTAAGSVFEEIAASGYVVWEDHLDGGATTIEQVAAWRAQHVRRSGIPHLDIELLRATTHGHLEDAPLQLGPWMDTTNLPEMRGPGDGTVRASVIIPLYGGLEFTRRCIASLAAAGWDERDELILVDNGSPDGTGDWLSELGARARVVRNTVNRNFAGGCNDGAGVARGDTLVFLNNDTEVRAGWLDALLEPFAESDVEITGGLLTYPNGTVQHAGIAVERFAFPRHVADGFPATLASVRGSYDVQAVTGAQLAVRRTTFMRMDGFDEAFRNGCEDLDLCWRVRAAGGRIRYVGTIATTHHVSVSSGRHAHDDANAALLEQRWQGRVFADLVLGEEVLELARASHPWTHGAATTSIVVPLYGNVELSRACVNALVATTRHRDDVELILVDNRSPDATRDWLRSVAEVARTILLPENVNFAGACNAGLARALARNVVFLNNDTEVQPGWLEPIEQALEDPDIGVVGALLTYPDGTVQHAGVYVPDGGDPTPLHVHVGEAPDGPLVTRARELQMVTGACMAMRRATALQVGGFDEGYANGMEDLDLCLRIRVSGRRVWYEPLARVIHHESKSIGRFAYAKHNLQRFFERWDRSLIPDAHTTTDHSSVDDLLGDDTPTHAVRTIDLRGTTGRLAARLNPLLVARDATHVLVLLDAPAHEAPAPTATESARVTLTSGDGWVGVLAPQVAIDAVGGIETRIDAEVDDQLLLADWLDRMRLFGWAIDDHSMGALGAPLPWRSGSVHSDGTGQPLDVQARWGTISQRRRVTSMPAPLIAQMPPVDSVRFERRAHAILLLHDDAAEDVGAAAHGLFVELADRDDVTIVVRIPTNDRGHIAPALEHAADLAESHGDLVDVVVVEGDSLLDPALVEMVDEVVVASAGPSELVRARSLLRAAGTPLRTVARARARTAPSESRR